MLFVAIDPVGQDRIIIRSVKMHIPTMWEPHGFENGRDLLRAIGHSSKGVEFQLVVSSKHLVINDGIIADEVDYSNDKQAGSFIALQIGDNLIYFRCDAKSAADLKVLTDSVLSVVRTE